MLLAKLVGTFYRASQRVVETQIENEAGQNDYPYFWTSTTHLKFSDMGGADNAVYIKAMVRRATQSESTITPSASATRINLQQKR